MHLPFVGASRPDRMTLRRASWLAWEGRRGRFHAAHRSLRTRDHVSPGFGHRPLQPAVRLLHAFRRGRIRRKERLLTYEEILRVIKTVAARGVTKIRITGGEPLVRRMVVEELLEPAVATPGINEVYLSTNALLLERHARRLRETGLKGFNISLDTMRPETFRKMARREGLEEVLRAIRLVIELGFPSVKLNMVVFEPTAGDLAFLQITSGTTGAPKAAMLTHCNLTACLEANEKVITGEWWDEGTPASEPEVSIEEGFLRNTRLNVGDQMSFDILGRVTPRALVRRAARWVNSDR